MKKKPGRPSVTAENEKLKKEVDKLNKKIKHLIDDQDKDLEIEGNFRRKAEKENDDLKRQVTVLEHDLKHANKHKDDLELEIKVRDNENLKLKNLIVAQAKQIYHL